VKLENVLRKILPSSEIQFLVWRVWSYVSDENIVSIFKVKKSAKQENLASDGWAGLLPTSQFLHLASYGWAGLLPTSQFLHRLHAGFLLE
jgi:hypothetical protein